MTAADKDNLVFKSFGCRYLGCSSNRKEIANRGAKPFLDEADINVGAEFEEDIREFLERATELLVLFTPWSFERPYVWAEIGAAWIRRIPIVVILHSVSPKDFQAHPNAPVFLKKRDMITINEVDTYFEQLEARVNRKEGEKK